MLARACLWALILLGTAGLALGQTGSATSGRAPTSTAWRSVRDETEPGSGTAPGAAASAQSEPATVAAEPVSPRVARVTNGGGSLPNEHGQLWREYDISPYTLRVTSTSRPEQAIIDWILRETGYEVWHTEPLGILSATSRTLRVYHTPQMQNVVADVVDRFVSSEAKTNTYGLRVVTVGHPNWRARAQRFLRPVEVQTPGVQAWLMQREEAAILLAQLRRRTDFREHSSPHLMVNNGQSSVISATRARSYVRGVSSRADVWPGFEAETALIDEGFSLEFSPLLSVDKKVIDATIKCEIDQVEKMIPVMLDVPTVVAPRQRTEIEVPQLTHFRFHERFRWPADQVLLVGMGMVALPVPAERKSLVPGIPLSLGSSPPRADLLVFVEGKGQSNETPGITRAGQSESTTYRGRY